MKYLGSERTITQDFLKHGDAEDYSGAHLSEIKLNGSAKVVKVVNKYKSHEDSINYNDFLNNQNKWKDGNYYNCISITGKNIRYYYDELGGNQVHLETIYNKETYMLQIMHLDRVNVNVGDIVNNNTVIGYQGNTGLVLSNKNRSNSTYGTHVHLEVKDASGKSINPRMFADGSIKYNYILQSNAIDNSKQQFEVLVRSINIRQLPSESSKDLGNVYDGEVYDILEIVDSNIYTWYKIKTSLGVIGYVANEKNNNWLKVSEPNKPSVTIDISDNNAIGNKNNLSEDKILFECQKDGIYYLRLRKGEKIYLKSTS